MKLITLNILGGHVRAPLLNFISSHQDIDICKTKSPTTFAARVCLESTSGYDIQRHHDTESGDDDERKKKHFARPAGVIGGFKTLDAEYEPS